MKIEQRDLDYFVVIAEQGNIGRAAEKLNLSQPALSLCLRRLERAANTKIVVRSPKGIELTPAGTVLLAHIDRLRLVQEDVFREMSDLGEGLSGTLRIGVSVGGHELLMASASCKLINDAPRLALTIEVDRVSALLQALHKGELDVIFVAATSDAGPGIVQEQTCVARHVVYASARHRLARRKSVGITELARERWAFSPGSHGMLALLRQKLADLGQPPPNIAVSSNSNPLRWHIVANTNLLGFAAEWFVRRASRRHRLAVIKVDGLNLERHSMVMYREGGYLSPATRRLIQLLKDVDPDNV